MQMNFRSNPEDIYVGIGPSIGPDHYEVKEDVIQHAEICFNDLDNILEVDINGKTTLNLWEANRRILIESGVKNIELAGICTACHTRDWFSHRAENGNTGRFGALLALNEEKNV